VEKVKTTRQRISAELTRRGFEVWPSQTNFLWVRPPRRSAAEWYDYLRRHKILIRHFTADRTRAHLRITIGTDPQMDRLLATIDADGSC
jgi:histidinol-phosphate aminotransferase